VSSPGIESRTVWIRSRIGLFASAVTRNEAQVRVEIDAPLLHARLLEARTRELETARALAANVLLNGERRPAPEPRATYVSVHRASSPGHLGRLSFGYVSTTSESGSEEVYVTNEANPGFGDPDETKRRWSALLGVEIKGDFITGSIGDATTGVAQLLGYRPDDIVLVDASDRPADVW
jgi:hypothetical protein